MVVSTFACGTIAKAVMRPLEYGMPMSLITRPRAVASPPAIGQDIEDRTTKHMVE